MNAKKRTQSGGSMMRKPSLTGKGSSSGVARTTPAANVSNVRRRVGMSDIRGHSMSWLAGYIYVGNGTLGATDSVYFCDPTKTYTIVNNAGIGANVPVAGGDALVGATYIGDVIKHFSRMRINSQRLILEPLQPSTANSMVALVAPQKGSSGIGKSATDTTAGLTYTNVISMNGMRQAASWESCSIDLTGFIGGGSGQKQNEFDINAGIDANGESSQSGYAARGVIPTSFAVSGSNSTTGLRGTVTHAVFIEQSVDLLDYIGGNNATYPEGVTRSVVHGLSSIEKKHSTVTGKSTIDVKSLSPHERKRSLVDVNEDLRKLSAEFKSSNEDLNACKQILKEALSSWDSKVNSPDVRLMIQRELADNTNTLRINTENLLKQKGLLLKERELLAIERDKIIAPSSTAAAVAEFALSTDEKDFVILSEYAKPPLVRAQQKAGTASG
jgi:hypothetical protein